MFYAKLCTFIDYINQIVLLFVVFLNQTSWSVKCVFHSMNIFSNHLTSFLLLCQTAHAPENI